MPFYKPVLEVILTELECQIDLVNGETVAACDHARIIHLCAVSDVNQENVVIVEKACQRLRKMGTQFYSTCFETTSKHNCSYISSFGISSSG